MNQCNESNPILLNIQRRQGPSNPRVDATATNTKAATGNIFTDTDAIAFDLVLVVVEGVVVEPEDEGGVEVGVLPVDEPPAVVLLHWLALTFLPHSTGSFMAWVTLTPNCLTASLLRRLQRHWESLSMTEMRAEQHVASGLVVAFK